ncbi:hypothetical protein MRX96_000356 [Rhipicephalus microplus]
MQHMKTLSKSKLPDVIALQEPFDRAQLPGYVTCGSPCECTGKDIKGTCRDTSPDFSIWSDAGAITWSNTFEDVKSDPRVLRTRMGEDENKMDGCQKARVVDWEQFREQRERDKQERPIEDIGELCRELLADIEKATKEIE